MALASTQSQRTGKKSLQHEPQSQPKSKMQGKSIAKRVSQESQTSCPQRTVIQHHKTRRESHKTGTVTEHQRPLTLKMGQIQKKALELEKVRKNPWWQRGREVASADGHVTEVRMHVLKLNGQAEICRGRSLGWEAEQDCCCQRAEPEWRKGSGPDGPRETLILFRRAWALLLFL